MSSVVGSPRGFGLGIVLPFRKTASVLAKPCPVLLDHLFAVHGEPGDVVGFISVNKPPWNHPRRLKTGWSLPRHRISLRQKSRSSPSTFSQSYPGDLVVLAVGIVVSPCVRPISSPPSTIGTPWERSKVARKFRFWQFRKLDDLSIVGGPSSPPSSRSDCGFLRHDSLHRWLRCACRCRKPGRSV